MRCRRPSYIPSSAVGHLSARAIFGGGILFSSVLLGFLFWLQPTLFEQRFFALLLVFVGFGFLTLMLGLLSRFVIQESRSVQKLLRDARRDKRIIARERQKADDLLLNILPESVARELKETGKSAPVYFESATVLFTDFAGFTGIAAGLQPVELLAALEIQSFMERMKALKAEQGFPCWELRLGINSGPLVAGVIGEKKFAYDIWGDTVNTASRMESGGEPGRVNISGATHTLIKNFFLCEHRGRIAAKGKGEIDMYFVKAIRPELSIDGKGFVPNARFKEMRASSR